MEKWTEQDRREAFAAWDDYRVHLDELIRRHVEVGSGQPTLTDNLLVMIIYADAYLAGREREARRRDGQG